MRKQVKPSMTVACAAIFIGMALTVSGAVRKLVLIGGYGDWENGQIVAFAEKKNPVVLTFSAPRECVNGGWFDIAN